MNRSEYESLIWAAMKLNGTNKDQYVLAVTTLSEILERRDEVEQFYRQNSDPIVEHTNKAGATNFEQNPALRMLNDCNKTALLYMRELGLTPQSLRKINPEEAAEKKSRKTTLSKMIDLEGGDYDDI